MSREASCFQVAEPAGCPSLTSLKLKKQHPGGSPGDDLSCVWVLETGEEPMQEVVGEHVNLLALHPTTRKNTENY